MAAMTVSGLWLQDQRRPDSSGDGSVTRRLSTPKVRTGCQACKAAHFKCDEQKPSCGRCQKRGTGCHYLHSARLNAKPASTTVQCKNKTAKPPLTAPRAQQRRALLPNQAPQSLHRTQISSLSCLPSASIRPWEAQYSDSFRFLVVPRLHQQQSEFWCRTVLRESLRDGCVRSAMLALGALGRVQEQQCNNDDVLVPLYKSQVDVLARDHSTGRTMLNHYYQALVYYSKAITAFRQLLIADIEAHGNDSKHIPRSILTATVLLSQFELLQGNTDAADQITARSVALLCGRISDETQTRFKTKTAAKATEMATIVHSDDEDGMVFGAATIDDEGLREAGAELMLKTALNAAYSALYPKSREVVLALDLPFASGLDPPSAKESPAVFVRMWKRCLGVGFAWYFRLQARMLDAWQQQQQQQPQQGMATAVPEDHRPFDIRPFVVAHRQEQRALLDLLIAWQVAVQARLVAISSRHSNPAPGAGAGPDHEEYLTYSGIAVTIHSSYYSVRTAFDITGKSWDQHHNDDDDDDDDGGSYHQNNKVRHDSSVIGELLDQCELVVDMAIEQRRLEHSSKGHALNSTSLRDQGVIHDGAIPVLTQIAQQTRDRGFRMRAMDIWARMLGDNPHWDVLGTYLASKAVHDVEEEHRDSVTGEIPLNKQYVWVEGSWVEGYKSFRAVLVGKIPGADGVSNRRVVMIAAPPRKHGPVGDVL